MAEKRWTFGVSPATISNAPPYTIVSGRAYVKSEPVIFTPTT